MERSLVKMLTNRIRWAKAISKDGAGELTYGPEVTLACFISGEQKMVRNDSGQEILSTRQIIINGTKNTATISLNDKVTLPDGTKPPLVAVLPIYDEKSKITALELFL